jgi:hypothetical protein
MGRLASFLLRGFSLGRNTLRVFQESKCLLFHPLSDDDNISRAFRSALLAEPTFISAFAVRPLEGQGFCQW